MRMLPRFPFSPLVLLVAVAVAPAAGAAAPPTGDPVVARVDGVEFHRSDIEAARQALPPQAQQVPMDKLYPLLLDRLVDGALVTEAAKKQHLEQDPAVQRQLKQDEDRIVQQAYLARELKPAM